MKPLLDCAYILKYILNILAAGWVSRAVEHDAVSCSMKARSSDGNASWFLWFGPVPPPFCIFLK